MAPGAAVDNIDHRVWNDNMLRTIKINRFFTPVLLLFFLVLNFSQFLFPQQYTVPDLEKIVVQLGKLDFARVVPIKHLSKKQLKAYIGAKVEEEYPDRLSEKEGVFLYLMGFSSRRLDPKGIRKKILVNNARALYDRRTKELLAVNEYRSVDMMNGMVLLHELRLAVQDGHFEVGKALGNLSDFDDRKLALLSVVIGDAAFISVQFSGFNAGMMSSTFDSDPLISFSPIGNTAQLYKAPEVVKQKLIMPYIYGLRFVTTAFQKKKWKALNRILTSPPESTEQVLHPDKYFNRDAPLEITVEYKPDGYPVYHSGVIGEHYLNILLMEKKQSGYVDRAAGWGGDTFIIYGNGASYFLIWKSKWDKPKYCSNYFFDFKRFIERRFLINFKEGDSQGSPFLAGHTRDGYFFLRKVRNEMIYVRSNDRKQMNKYIYGGIYD